MDGYNRETYGEQWAEIYDEVFSERFDVEETVATLAELAAGGPALELGIGTGRLALPLARRAVPVSGIDASEAMIAKLRAKTGGAEVPVTLGDFADVGVTDSFSLIFVAFNTFFALLSQAEQVRCFANVAARLRTDGVFLIEAFVPDLTRFRHNQGVTATSVAMDEVMFDVARHDPVSQRVFSQHVHLTEAGVRLLPVQIRYAWPSELDLMARLAGLRLRHRWENWRRAPFTAASQGHISVYEHGRATHVAGSMEAPELNR